MALQCGPAVLTTQSHSTDSRDLLSRACILTVSMYPEFVELWGFRVPVTGWGLRKYGGSIV